MTRARYGKIISFRSGANATTTRVCTAAPGFGGCRPERNLTIWRMPTAASMPSSSNGEQKSPCSAQFRGQLPGSPLHPGQPPELAGIRRGGIMVSLVTKKTDKMVTGLYKFRKTRLWIRVGFVFLQAFIPKNTNRGPPLFPEKGPGCQDRGKPRTNGAAACRESRQAPATRWCPGQQPVRTF